MASASLPTSIQTKGMLLSRNNEVMIFTLTQMLGDVDTCVDGIVEMAELTCTGTKEELICTALGYLCNPSAFTTRELK